ncbi:hypothetical protein [Streptomyces sp. UNOC14_S4]|nr:hypothetical protein [Streptomyces sp. UNOC14_S4]MCC3767196.1 hypothetical protein [Streptomyces sp. UNOC14_S4]
MAEQNRTEYTFEVDSDAQASVSIQHTEDSAAITVEHPTGPVHISIHRVR